MVNKKIRARNKKAAKVAEAATTSSSSDSKDVASASAPVGQQQHKPTTTTPMKGFSNAQLAGLILLSIGITKIMDFAKALREGKEFNATTDEEVAAAAAAPKMCMSYLNDIETCTHKSFVSLIQMKYYTSLQVLWLVLSLMWHTWNTEYIFQKLMTCLCLSPLVTTIVAVITSQEYIQNNGRSFHLIMMCIILGTVIMPNKIYKFPFIHKGNDMKFTTKTLQSMCLITCIVSSLADIIKPFHSSTTTNNNNTIENSFFITDLPFPESARGLIYFYFVDKFTMLLLYLFALLHFPERQQRTFLLTVALLKLMEYFYQLPNMIDELQNLDGIKHVLLFTSTFAGISWIAPRLTWK